MVSVVTSFSPRLSRSRTILETVCSMRSGSTLRLRIAMVTERASLSRSNGTRRPLRLMTTSSRSCTRSKVVKRNPQARHSRRRRIAEESSVGRESFTWVSRLAQLGQRMGAPSAVDREAPEQALDLVAYRGLDQSIGLGALLRQHVEHLGDQRSDLAEFRDAEAAGGAGRRAEANARRHRGLLRIERNAVLVAGDVGAPQRLLGDLSGQALGPQ